MTAEGDNRVLMQKVAKELLPMLDWPAVASRLKAAEAPLPAAAAAPGGAPPAPAALRALLAVREARCLRQLKQTMAAAGALCCIVQSVVLCCRYLHRLERQLACSIGYMRT